MKRIFILFIALLCVSSIRAQVVIPSMIPDSLMNSANAVVLFNNHSFKITAIDKAEETVHTAITILNKEGVQFGNFTEYYDKLTTLSSIEISVYDANGNRIQKVKSNDILDISAVSGISIYEDSRVKVWEMEERSFPYTVEYSFVRNYKFLFFIPRMDFYPGRSVSVMSSEFVLEYPKHVGANYRENNFNGQRKSEVGIDSSTRITWIVTGLKPYKIEVNAPTNYERLPSIEFAPAKFSFAGYEGDMSTWDGFTDWIRMLNENLEPIPEPTINKLKAMTAEMSDLDKIRVVYDYLQKNSRYVSIQLGIGGFQPFAPAVTDKLGYGDCKALSFYTKAMLEAVGIRANYTLISAGDQPAPLRQDFPVSNFNHVVLSVPQPNDTIWLECTSQVNPFGYTGGFTGNRKALVILDDGYRIVRTPRFSFDQNIQTSSTDVQIDIEGNASVKTEVLFKGQKREYRNLDQILHQGLDRQKRWLENEIDVPTFSIESFNLNPSGADINLSTKIMVQRLASKSGSRLFIQPNVMNKNTWIPPKTSDRLFDIVIDYGYTEKDIVSINVPEGFHVEALPEKVEIRSDFGYYSAEVVIENGILKYHRYFRQIDGTFDKKRYEEFLNFHKEVVNADKRKVAFVTKT